MANNGIDLGSLPIYVSNDVYEQFCNQQEKQETKRNRAVLKTDYQRFIWAFVLGIQQGKRLPLSSKKVSPFKWNVIPQDSRTLLLGLTLQEMYSACPEKIKEDVDNMDPATFNDSLRLAIEEYANAGFKEIQTKTLYNELYIEDFDAIIDDIVGEKPDTN